MKETRFSEEQIVAVLKEAEAGVPVKELSRRIGVSDATFYHWKAKYGGLEVNEARRMRGLLVRLTLTEGGHAGIVHPTIRNRIYLLGRMVKTRGIQAALHHYLSRLNMLQQRRQKTQTDVPLNDADRLSQLSTPADLRIHSVHAKWGVHYAPSRTDIFRKAIRSLPIRFEDYAFIDLGAGKGEMLLLAADYEFRRVVGVEYSETLTAIASTNVRTATGLLGKSVECLCADATEFDLSHDPAVLYLYNPFQGKAMDKVVRNIEQSLRAAPRNLWIIYVTPWEHRKFVRSHHLKTVVENWDVPGWEFCIYRSII